MCEQYNGWTNRETWLVGVHDFFDYEMIQEVITDMVTKPPQGYGQSSLGGPVRAYMLQLADWMCDYHFDYIEEATWNLNPYVRDFIAYQKINWLEIAEHYDNEIKDALQKVEV